LSPDDANLTSDNETEYEEEEDDNNDDNIAEKKEEIIEPVVVEVVLTPEEIEKIEQERKKKEEEEKIRRIQREKVLKLVQHSKLVLESVELVKRINAEITWVLLEPRL